MNIGIVCYASVGGSGIVATELGKALALRGHQVHFISTETPFRLGEFQAGLSFHQVLTPTYPLFREPQYMLSLANKVVQVAREFHLDALPVQAQALARTGSRERAELEVERAISEIPDPNSPSPTDARFIAGALLAVGRENDALNLLERVRPRGAWLWFYCLSPDFDSIRAHPRFVSIMREAHPGFGGAQRR